MSIHIVVREPFPNPRTVVVCDRCGLEARMPYVVADVAARNIAILRQWWTDQQRDLCGDCHLIHGTGEDTPHGILNGPNR